MSEYAPNMDVCIDCKRTFVDGEDQPSTFTPATNISEELRQLLLDWDRYEPRDWEKANNLIKRVAELEATQFVEKSIPHPDLEIPMNWEELINER